MNLKDITEKYPDVTEEGILDGIEIATMRVLEQLHGVPAGAVIGDEGISATLYKVGGFEDIHIPSLPRKAIRRLIDEIEIELMRRQTYGEANIYKSIRGSVQTGVIEHIYDDGTLLVRITFNDVLNPIEIYGECPISQQPRHERGTYTVGTAHHFMITACLPVANRRRVKIRLVASRAARELPSRMLGQLIGVPGIQCKKREPSGRSHIVTRHDLPKKAVISVSDELNETIIVTWANRPNRKPMSILPTTKHNKNRRLT